MAAMATISTSTTGKLPDTFNSLITHFGDFLTLTIHTLLYLRDIYPRETFLTTRAHSYPVHQSRHPAVCTWIRDSVQAVRSQLLTGTVARVVVVIYGPPYTRMSSDGSSTFSAASMGGQNGTTQVLERYIFDVSRFPVVAVSQWEDPIERLDNPTNASTDVSVDLSEQLRATLAALHTLTPRLAPVPHNSTYGVVIELRDEADPPIGHPQPWVPVQPNLQRARILAGGEKTGGGRPSEGRMGNSRLGGDLGGARTTPVRAVDAGEMIFEMWIEEGKAKFSDESRNKLGSQELSNQA